MFPSDMVRESKGMEDDKVLLLKLCTMFSHPGGVLLSFKMYNGLGRLLLLDFYVSAT